MRVRVSSPRYPTCLIMQHGLQPFGCAVTIGLPVGRSLRRKEGCFVTVASAGRQLRPRAALCLRNRRRSLQGGAWGCAALGISTALVDRRHIWQDPSFIRSFHTLIYASIFYTFYMLMYMYIMRSSAYALHVQCVPMQSKIDCGRTFEIARFER